MQSLKDSKVKLIMKVLIEPSKFSPTSLKKSSTKLPRTPPPIPISTDGSTAITLTATKSFDVNFVLNNPKSCLYLNPWNEELSKSVVNVAVMQQKNTCQDNLFFQNDETSSMAKSRPPTGAPKADAIPAAAPALIKFLLSSELRNLKKQ